MNYRKRSDGSQATLSEIKAAHPNTSFPKPFTSAAADGLGYDPVLSGARPTTSTVYQSQVMTGIEQKDGIWYEKWEVKEADDDGKKVIDDKKAANERVNRDNALKDSDWTQSADKGGLSDSKVTEWATYRASLRNLPTASGWPHTHTWPTKPS